MSLEHQHRWLLAPSWGGEERSRNSSNLYIKMPQLGQPCSLSNHISSKRTDYAEEAGACDTRSCWIRDISSTSLSYPLTTRLWSYSP